MWIKKMMEKPLLEVLSCYLWVCWFFLKCTKVYVSLIRKSEWLCWHHSRLIHKDLWYLRFREIWMCTWILRCKASDPYNYRDQLHSSYQSNYEVAIHLFSIVRLLFSSPNYSMSSLLTLRKSKWIYPVPSKTNLYQQNCFFWS